jgi:hypothetical protein
MMMEMEMALVPRMRYRMPEERMTRMERTKGGSRKGAARMQAAVRRRAVRRPVERITASRDLGRPGASPVPGPGSSAGVILLSHLAA